MSTYKINKLVVVAERFRTSNAALVGESVIKALADLVEKAEDRVVARRERRLQPAGALNMPPCGMQEKEGSLLLQLSPRERVDRQLRGVITFFLIYLCFCTIRTAFQNQK